MDQVEKKEFGRFAAQYMRDHPEADGDELTQKYDESKQGKQSMHVYWEDSLNTTGNAHCVWCPFMLF
ncbi:12115_t:CDS:1, partial [Ambispora gerdemannii]